MNKIARKLVLSILTVVLTVIALGTTTFAWFTLTNTAQVQQFQAQIIADTGIEIAIGHADTDVANYGLDWVTLLTTDTVNTFISDEYDGGFEFQSVTTANGMSFFRLGFDEGNPVTNVPASSGYLELPLHFKSNDATRILWTNATLSSTTFTWNVNQAFTDETGTGVSAPGQIQVDASNAFRMLVHGYLDGVGSNNIVAYEKPVGGRNYNIPAPVDPDTTVDLEGANGAMSYYYNSTNTVPGGINAVQVLQTITSISSVPVLDMLEVTLPGESLATNYGTVVVRVWLEGWDPNAYNSILGRIINASLQFEGSTTP